MIYVGIKLSPDLQEMTTLNFDPLLQKTKTKLGKWGKLNLTLWGKVNVVKMVIAPQFNYLFMMIPLNISDHILNSMIVSLKTFCGLDGSPDLS